MGVLGVKIAVLALIAAIKMASGLTPMFLFPRMRKKDVKKRVIDKVMAGVLCLGGGVLLATVFVHMMPEVRETLATAVYKMRQRAEEQHGSSHHSEHDHDHHGAEEDSGSNSTDHSHHDHGDHHEDHHGHEEHGHHDDDYPYAELLVCLGFFICYFLEAAVHKVIFKGVHESGHGHAIPNQMLQQENGVKKTSVGCENFSFDNKEESEKEDTSKNVEPNSQSDNGTTTTARENKLLFTVRNLLVVMALSVHSVFEGMAVGLQLRSVDVWKLFLAILVHAVPIHFCIGMEMVSAGIRRLHTLAYISVLAVSTPLGIVIGIAATSNVGTGGDGATQDLVIAVLSGLAAGTLLYVTFFEVLDRDKLGKSGMTGLLGWFLLVTGFGLMAAFEAVGGHSHGVEEAIAIEEHSDQALNDHDHHGHSHDH